MSQALLFKTQGWTGRALSFVLGGLAVLGQAPFHFWPITLLCLALLFARLQWAASGDKPARAGLGAAFWFAFGYFLVGTHWIGSAFIARGPEFIPAMPPMILALGTVLASFWGLAGYIFGRLNPKGFAAGIAFVSFIFIAEFIRGHLFGGFPWNLLGYIFKAGDPISQSASIFGIYGLSLVVLILSTLLSSLLFSKARLKPAIGILGVLITLTGFGYLRLNNAQSETVEDVRLRIVQVRFDQKDKFDPQKSVAIVNQFLTQSVVPGIEDITHIIWPEGAVNGLALENEALMEAMGAELSFIDDTPPIWLLNSLRNEQRPNPLNGGVIDDYYNTSAAVSFTSGGIPSLAAFSDKQRLVPFGEFIPGGKWMEMRDVPVISTSLLSISPASEKENVTFPGLPRLSAQICYEIIFSGFTPNSEKELRAQWILNQSNDAWYGESIGPQQHANMSAYRAIEEGLPVVRAASNGISGIINPYGAYISEAKPTETRIIDTRLPKPLKSTVFSMAINYLLLLINLLTSLWCASLGRNRALIALK